MTIRFSTLRRHAGLLCLSLALFTGVSLVRADDAPKFSDPDVTAYAKAYGDFADQYSANMKNYLATVKTGDTAKMQDAAKKMQDDAAKAQEMVTRIRDDQCQGQAGRDPEVHRLPAKVRAEDGGLRQAAVTSAAPRFAAAAPQIAYFPAIQAGIASARPVVSEIIV